MADCKHPHLTFEDGELYLRCIDCDHYWGNMTQKGGQLDYTAQGRNAISIDKTRHSKWMLPRDKKEAKPVKKSVDHFGRKICTHCGHPENSATCQKSHP